MSENFATLKRGLEAFAAKDLEAMLAGLHPEIVVNQMPALPYGGAYYGKDGFVNVLKALVAHWSDLSAAPHTFHDAGDTIVVRFKFVATGRPTERRVETEMVEFFHFRDNLIAGIDVFFWDVTVLVAALTPQGVDDV